MPRKNVIAMTPAIDPDAPFTPLELAVLADSLMSINEAADHCRVSRQMIADALERGDLRAHIKFGEKRKLVSRIQLLAYVGARMPERMEGTPPGLYGEELYKYKERVILNSLIADELRRKDFAAVEIAARRPVMRQHKKSTEHEEPIAA